MAGVIGDDKMGVRDRFFELSGDAQGGSRVVRPQMSRAGTEIRGRSQLKSVRAMRSS